MTGYDQEMRTDATRTVCFDGKPLVSATGPRMQCSGSVILHKLIIPPQEVESDLAKGTDSFFSRTHKESVGCICQPCIQISLKHTEEASVTHAIV